MGRGARAAELLTHGDVVLVVAVLRLAQMERSCFPGIGCSRHCGRGRRSTWGRYGACTASPQWPSSSSGPSSPCPGSPCRPRRRRPSRACFMPSFPGTTPAIAAARSLRMVSRPPIPATGVARGTRRRRSSNTRKWSGTPGSPRATHRTRVRVLRKPRREALRWPSGEPETRYVPEREPAGSPST